MVSLKNYAIIIITIFFAFAIITSSAYAGSITAKVLDIPDNNVKGQVLFKNPSEAKFKLVKKGDVISENGIIATGKDPKAMLDLIIYFGKEKSFMRVSNNTYLKLSPYEDKMQVVLGRGKVLVQNQNSHKLNVSLGNYVAASEGTTFTAALEPNPDNNELDSNIEVLEGSVKFWDPAQPNTMPSFIMPGEKVRLIFRLNKISQKIKNNNFAVLNQSIGQLKENKIYNDSQILALSQLFNRLSNTDLSVREKNIQNFKINLSNALLNRNNLFLENIKKIDENQNLQIKDKLKQINEMRRLKLIERFKANHPQIAPLIEKYRLKSQTNTKIIPSSDKVYIKHPKKYSAEELSKASKNNAQQKTGTDATVSNEEANDEIDNSEVKRYVAQPNSQANNNSKPSDSQVQPNQPQPNQLNNNATNKNVNNSNTQIKSNPVQPSFAQPNILNNNVTNKNVNNINPQIKPNQVQPNQTNNLKVKNVNMIKLATPKKVK